MSAPSSEAPSPAGRVLVRGSAALNGYETLAGYETAGCLSIKPSPALPGRKFPTPALASYTP
jgi:hypothetical protein